MEDNEDRIYTYIVPQLNPKPKQLECCLDRNSSIHLTASLAKCSFVVAAIFSIYGFLLLSLQYLTLVILQAFCYLSITK